MGPRPRGLGNWAGLAVTSPGGFGFNGAETARSRKWMRSSSGSSPRSLASMGPRPRGLGNTPRQLVKGCGGNASMGPRPRGLGNYAVLVESVTERRLQWGRDRAVSEIPKPMKAPAWCRRLQWGRDRAVSEISRGRWRARFVHRASMGPRPRGLGNNAGSVPAEASEGASMGPRPRGLGN